MDPRVLRHHTAATSTIINLFLLVVLLMARHLMSKATMAGLGMIGDLHPTVTIAAHATKPTCMVANRGDYIVVPDGIEASR
jgi:hypothetical protein